jgi:hypothetical protein
VLPISERYTARKYREQKSSLVWRRESPEKLAILESRCVLDVPAPWFCFVDSQTAFTSAEACHLHGLQDHLQCQSFCACWESFLRLQRRCGMPKRESGALVVVQEAAKTVQCATQLAIGGHLFQICEKPVL